MSTAQLERPARTAPPHGGVPARRAAIRWAWRLLRREWRQQLLVLALITVAVAATILGAGVGTNTPPAAHAGFGTADHLVSLPGGDPRLAADIAAVRARFGPADVIENARLTTGTVQAALLRSQDPAGRFGRPMLALLSGRYPAGPGQVAMTRQLAATLGLRVGSTWHHAGRALRVTGLVENPQNLLDNFALVAPGQLSAPGQVTVLFDAPGAAAGRFRLPGGVTPQAPQVSIGFKPALVVLALTIFGLIFIGLVAVAGFTTLAQRRLRALGMLSSLGATDRNVRLVMVANGAAVGALGAVLGAVIGLAAWIAYVPHFSVSVNHRVTWTELPWWLVVTGMVLAVVTATLAARRPARIMARVPVVAALSGRPAPPKAVHRSALPGAALLIAGLVLLVFCGGWSGSSGRDLLFQLGGLLAIPAGLLLLAPLAISALAVIARHAPVAARIALRDLSRYRARSGAALAAISLAILIAVLVALIATGRFADPVDYFGPNLPANELVVYAPGTGPGSGPGFGPATPVQPALLQPRVRAIAAALGSRDVLPLEPSGALLARQTTNGATGGPGEVYVATPAVLSHYGIGPGSVPPGTLLISSRPGLTGLSGLQLVGGGKPGRFGCNAHCIANPRIMGVSSLPTDSSDPNLLITSEGMRRLGLRATVQAWLIHAPRPLTAVQINSARQTAAAARMTIEAKSETPSISAVRNYATAGGILIALGVLAMTVGLIRAEAAGDLRTLTATGASSRTRRAITAATAGALGLLGALLGTAVGYLATAAFFRSEFSERMSHVPVLDLLLILLALPAAAAVGGWLFAGREPPAIARQPLE